MTSVVEYTKEAVLLEPYAQAAVKELMFGQQEAHKELREQLLFAVFLKGGPGSYQYASFQAMWGNASAVNNCPDTLESGTYDDGSWGVHHTFRGITKEYTWIRGPQSFMTNPIPLRVIVSCLQLRPANQAAINSLPPSLKAAVQPLHDKLRNRKSWGGFWGARVLSAKKTKVGNKDGVPLGTLALVVDDDLDQLPHFAVKKVSQGAVGRLRCLVEALCTLAGVELPPSNLGLNPQMTNSQQVTVEYYVVWRSFTDEIYKICRQSDVKLLDQKKNNAPLEIKIADDDYTPFHTQEHRNKAIEAYGTTQIDAMSVVNALHRCFSGIHLVQARTDSVRHGGVISADALEQLKANMKTTLQDIRAHLVPQAKAQVVA